MEESPLKVKVNVGSPGSPDLRACVVKVKRLAPSTPKSTSTSTMTAEGNSNEKNAPKRLTTTATPATATASTSKKKPLSVSPQDGDFQKNINSLLEEEEEHNDNDPKEESCVDESESDIDTDDLPLADLTLKAHKSVVLPRSNDPSKRLDSLLRRAEEHALAMKPTYTAALKELVPAPVTEADTSSPRGNSKTKKGSKAARLQAPVFDTSPDFIRNGTMRDYQVKGLNWLISLYNNGINGILADEMGLGKTIQTISLLGYLKHHRKVNGPHLVIAPKSTVSNWTNEFTKWCPTLKTICMIAQKPDRAAFIRNTFWKTTWDVCITTYDIARHEAPMLSRVDWVYVVVDEAQRIKNDKAALSQSIRRLKSTNRLLLSGTPLQNNLHELWSFLNYLLPDIFNSASDFDTWFNMENIAQDPKLVARLHTILRPFLLRRVKSDVETSLPPKREMKVYVSLTPMQKEWYRKILLKDIDVLGDNGYADDKKYTLFHNLLMHLRKVCNHPYLFTGAEPGPPYTTDGHLVENAGKMQVLDKLLDKLKAQGSRVVLFSQFTTMLDILEDYCFWKGYEILRLDGSVRHGKRQADIDEFNAEGSSKFIFLISTRAGGLGINLATADVVILYDSDWNPQVDLQAQDRCHRIGQTKEVRVFRFVTERTVEEKIQQIAQKKLWLDHTVIQEGRLADVADVGAVKMSRQNLQEVIRFGAKEILSEETGAVSASIDEDIDAILKRSKEKDEKLAELSAVPSTSTQQGQGPEGEGYEYDFHHFEGTDFRKLRREKEKEKENSFTVADPRRKTKLLSPPPQDISLKQDDDAPTPAFDFQFFPYRYYELVAKEGDYCRRMSRLKPHIEFSTDELSLHEIREIKQFEAERIRAALPLTEEEMEEKAWLEKDGFGSWARKSFRRYLKLLGTHGADNLNLVSASLRGKEPDEVLAYHQAFMTRSHEVYKYEEFYAKYGLEGLVVECNARVEGLLDLKFSQCAQTDDSQLKLKYPLAGGGFRFSEENDRALLEALQGVILKNGKSNWTFGNLAARIQGSRKYDLFLRSRNAKELQARCSFLLHCIQQEYANSQASASASMSMQESQEPSQLSNQPPPKDTTTTSHSRKRRHSETETETAPPPPAFPDAGSDSGAGTELPEEADADTPTEAAEAPDTPDPDPAAESPTSSPAPKKSRINCAPV